MAAVWISHDVALEAKARIDFAKLRRILEAWAFSKNQRKVRDDISEFELMYRGFLDDLARIHKAIDAGLKCRAPRRQYFANLKKTLSGLIRMAVLHNMAKSTVCPQTVAAYRVRQINVTHPTFAPPSAV
ncbi:hypothetical protein [Massilia eburnea]|uniref:hypothetical protein n=1 Tax=Massilia eburnea TaxID=1776165 RepID=UPI003D6C6D29